MTFYFFVAALAQPVINLHFTVSEESFNRHVNVCVEINSLPENGLECDTVIYLVAQSGTASMLTYVIKPVHLCTCYCTYIAKCEALTCTYCLQLKEKILKHSQFLFTLKTQLILVSHILYLYTMRG